MRLGFFWRVLRRRFLHWRGVLYGGLCLRRRWPGCRIGLLRTRRLLRDSAARSDDAGRIERRRSRRCRDGGMAAIGAGKERRIARRLLRVLLLQWRRSEVLFL